MVKNIFKISFVMLFLLLFSTSVFAAKQLTSVSMTAPTSAQTINMGDTFTITCDPACSGGGSNPSVTDYYQYSTVSDCSSGNTDITTNSATADVLSVGNNPETAASCSSTTDTITGRNPGTVYLNCFSTEGPRSARSPQCIQVTVNSPTYPLGSNPRTNETAMSQGEYILFETDWTAGDTSLDSYIFSVDDGAGTFTNYSAKTFTNPNNDVSAQTHQVLAAPGTTVQWRFFANDTLGNISTTAVQTFKVSLVAAPSGAGCGYVNNDLTLTGRIFTKGTCFTINASNVVLDGAGFNVTGNMTGFGVSATNFKFVTVKNLELNNFSDGVRLLSVFNATVYGNLVGSPLSSPNGAGVRALRSYGTNISDNRVMIAGANGITLEMSTNNSLVSGNVVSISQVPILLNHYHGINVTSNYTRVYFNNITVIRGMGIVVGGSSRNNLSYNNISASTNGVLFSGVSKSEASLNTVTNYGDKSILLTLSPYNYVSRNTVNQRSANDGIFVSGNSSTVYMNAVTVLTTTSGNGGIVVTGHNNDVSSNIVNAPNGGSGVILFFAPIGNLISGNNLVVSTGYGVAALNGLNNSEISSNVISTSGVKAYGIRLDRGVNLNINNNDITTLGSNAIGIVSQFFGVTSPKPAFTLFNSSLANNKVTTYGNGAYPIYLHDVNTNLTSNKLSVASPGLYDLLVNRSNNKAIFDHNFSFYVLLSDSNVSMTNVAFINQSVEVFFNSLPIVYGDNVDTAGNMTSYSNYVFVDVSKIPQFNRQATITFTDVSYASVDSYDVQVGGVSCVPATCTKLSSNPVRFEVTGFDSNFGYTTAPV